jgi:hypothetical protein
VIKRPSIPPEQLAGKIANAQAAEVKAYRKWEAAAAKAEAADYDHTSTERMIQAMERHCDAVEETAKLWVMRESWKAIVEAEILELTPSLNDAAETYTKLQTKLNRKAAQLKSL